MRCCRLTCWRFLPSLMRLLRKTPREQRLLRKLVASMSGAAHALLRIA